MSDVITLLSEFCSVKSVCKILRRIPCFFIKQGEILHHLGKDIWPKHKIEIKTHHNCLLGVEVRIFHRDFPPLVCLSHWVSRHSAVLMKFLNHLPVKHSQKRECIWRHIILYYSNLTLKLFI